MQVYSVENGFPLFLNAVAIQKQNIQTLSYLHVALNPQQEQKKSLPVAELTQFLSFCFPKENLIIFFLKENDGLLIITPKNDALSINRFEKALQESFPDFSFSTHLRGFDVLGMDLFTKLIEPYIQPGDQICRTLFTRMRRLRNCIMVLDDDKMVTHQLEKLISAMGLVVSINKPEEFLQQYAQYAPDILFLDIHLRTAKGNELLRDLIKNIDPFAYVVIISSDTEEKMVLDIKDGGAKGFVVKPFTRQGVVQHLFRAPTIISTAISQ
jgi:two-component system chemotaxis response regulator CheY